MPATGEDWKPGPARLITPEEGIASRILTGPLWRLLADGILTRAHAGRGHRAECSLIKAAIQLGPVMTAL